MTMIVLFMQRVTVYISKTYLYINPFILFYFLKGLLRDVRTVKLSVRRHQFLSLVYVNERNTFFTGQHG